MKRVAPLILLMLAPALFAPAAAAGDGPALGLDSPYGILSSTGGTRYQALQWNHETVVTAVDTANGRIVSYRKLPGRWGIPAVAPDGTATGLSADGTTLVLAESRSRFPRARTRVLVLGTGALRVNQRVTLRGDFSVDAISPDGGSLYLVEALSRRNPAHYQLRAYDLGRGRLLRQPIVDRREPDEKMQGYAVTRTTSDDGRWEYTFYDRPRGESFIHALDTVRGEAFCIDIDSISAARRVADVHLDLTGGGGRLTVLVGGRPGAIVNTRTFAVSEPRVRRPAARAPKPAPDDGGGGLPWQLLLAAAAAAALVSASLLIRRIPDSTRRPEPDREEETDTTVEVWR
jgi:hypothetical protein